MFGYTERINGIDVVGLIDENPEDFDFSEEMQQDFIERNLEQSQSWCQASIDATGEVIEIDTEDLRWL